MKYLTKSKFKLGLECPTKLYYTDKEVFPNQKVDDPFLEQFLSYDCGYSLFFKSYVDFLCINNLKLIGAR